MTEKTIKSPMWFFLHIFIGQVLYGFLFAIVFGFIWTSIFTNVISPKIDAKYNVYGSKDTKTFMKNEISAMTEQKKAKEIGSTILSLVGLPLVLFLSTISALRKGIIKVADVNKVVIYWLIIPLLLLIIRGINGTGIINTIITIVYAVIIAFFLRFLLLRKAEA
jgi:hypothetical protein